MIYECSIKRLSEATEPETPYPRLKPGVSAQWQVSDLPFI